MTLPLFMEDVYDALKAAVQAAGGPKKVAAYLWPTTPLERAKRDLNDCLNRGNGRKLDIEEALAILRLAKEAGFHQAKHWIDADTGYEPSTPADPMVERDRLAEEMARLSEQVARLHQAAARLNEQPIPISLRKQA